MTHRRTWIVTLTVAATVLMMAGLAYSAPSTQPRGPEASATQPAETGGGGNTITTTQTGTGGDNFLSKNLIFVMVALLVFMLFMSFRNKRKEERKRQEMLSSLKKGDRVISIGGIIGTVADIREDEVIVKVDDETRLKFLRSAIRAAGDTAKADAQQQDKK